MKFFLKSFLLFLIILAGKAVKQQTTLLGSIAEKQPIAPSMVMRPRQITSFSTRQISDAPTRVTTTQQLWHTTIARTELANIEAN